MIEIGKELIKISGEPIKKRRQTLFYSLVQEHEGVMVGLVSLSLALKGSIELRIIENFSEKYTSFSNFFGELVYLFLNDEIPTLKKRIRTQPKEIQVIAQWVFGDRFKTMLELEYLYTVLPRVLSLEELSVGFIQIPDFMELGSKAKGVMVFGTYEKLSTPFYLIRLNSKIRSRGKIRYYIKEGEDVYTNVTSKAVKDYLSRSLKNKFKVGVILGVVTEKLGSHKWNIQPFYMSEDIDIVKKAYRGSQVRETGLLQSLDMLNKVFPNSDKAINVYHTKPVLCNSVKDLAETRGGLVKGNLLIHDEGIVKLEPKKLNKYYKVYDYLFNEEFEPIGLKLLDEDGNIIEIETHISDDFIDKGIEKAYAKVGIYSIDGTDVKMEFYELLSKYYGECALCGIIAGLKKSGLCWRCNGAVFRIAVENGDKIEFETSQLISEKSKTGFTIFSYKYEVEITETALKFKECDWCWTGKQGYLPYDWWD